MTGPGRAAAGDSAAAGGSAARDGAGAPTVDLAALRREALRPGELLLDYYLGPDVSLLFAVTLTEVRAVRLLPEEAIAERLRLYHSLLAAPPGTDGAATPAEVAEAGDAAGAALLAGVADLLESCSRLIVVPDGVVNLVPFSELPAASAPARPERQPDSTMPRRSADARPVIARHEVVRVPSATVLARLRSGEARAAHGGPAARSRIVAIAGGSDAAGRPLAGVLEEARDLGSRYRGVTVRLGGLGMTPIAPAELADAGVLHLAAHFQGDDQRPWRSRFRFGADDSAATLSAAQVAAMRLPARLAVLSSCGTAEGRILSGEGVLGMTSAFLSAGTPAVVATLWPVDDAVTVRLIERFYAELSRGATVAAALRTAQLAVRAEPAWTHPFYWAGFVVCGEGSETVALTRAPSLSARLIALAALAISALAVVVSAAASALRRRRPPS